MDWCIREEPRTFLTSTYQPGVRFPAHWGHEQPETNEELVHTDTGVPRIVNHAYKMSTFAFPRAVTVDSSSRRILHACNRLATQQSPRHHRKHNMMAPAMETRDDGGVAQGTDLLDLLTSARDGLNSSRFDEAETDFLKLYNEIQEKPEDNGRLLVDTLMGLADICIRRSRMCRSNPLEWQWLCLHGIALLQYTAEFCESEFETQQDNQASEWYQEQKAAAEMRCRPLEDAFTRALYNCLKHDANFFDPFQSFSLPTSSLVHQRKSNVFPLSSHLPQYLLATNMSYRMTDKGLAKQNSDDSEVAVDWLAKFEFYCKDRLQTKDHKCVTEKVLRSTKSGAADEESESIMSDNSDNDSHGSLDWDHSDLQGIEEITSDVTDKDSPVNEYSLELELASSDTENDGWDFFLHQRRNCDFQSVVQIATKEDKNEIDCEIPTYSKETLDTFQQEKKEKKHRTKHIEAKDIVSPLHAHSISLTLARSFCRLADKLVQEEEYKKAEIVYEKIMDIIDAIQDGTAGMLRFSARIMKNLGTVKSKQGKSSSGLVLLNKALHTYRDLQDEEANFEIAVALIELGNGYIVGKNHEDSVFNDVIIAICDFFERDSCDSQSTSNSSSVQSHISQMTSSLTSNSEERYVEEAVTCYTEAISLLDAYEADEKQIDMFAKAIMRLGDCHFMQKDYDKALECYEKALGMFRSNNTFGRDSLMENAHVLCMLGVSSFMLHVYPRAASVFETALHMVRCAYGFKRTFLNGMLQSLAGITYYKMKNYHKCVSMCYQGYETYCELFGEGMSRLDKQKFWLVCQTLYVMGNSYNILNLQLKAMKYLTIARSLMKSCKSRERRQFMRVLQILGDCYFAEYDYKTALSFYNEALEYGECESQISFDEVFDPNCASDEMTIHNHLVSKSAEAHLSMHQYQNAVHYLEQAHDMQEVMGEDIRGDLIHTLHQLGHMHSAAGDVNKAIESYRECLEVFREIHKGQLGPEMCTTLGNLAAICYVKACISEDMREEQAMIESADAYFKEALSLETHAEVCVKYGNFLFSQCHFDEAINHLRNVLCSDRIATDIVYRGLEKVTLPELLQDEVDTQEEICLPSSCLARYLLILTHKALGEILDAEEHLICLMEEVWEYDVPLLYSLLGYAMMELALFEEAAESFRLAAEDEEEYQLAVENFCICLLILVAKTLIAGTENICHFLMQNNRASCV
ncbi:uncharacterized protein LOC128226521 isoform X2 [Mya arenaria]|uniref:uncharacterized protein LOC128226521 isoform X2 n=1 Tax=Mya arenaria TaxID=6604 RepID=UPI0022E01DB3|nr:uncharacterized protein LOC128226521 isoform X2 [Mya arenaria]